MADYICKGCTNNNNGWCTIKKQQGLKQIKDCTDKNIESESFPQNEVTVSSDDFAHAQRLLGKREMLWIIQQQVVAILNNETENPLKAILECLNTIEKSQHGLEQIFNVVKHIDSSIDTDMIQDSRYMSILIDLKS